jgi:hypothetical protein
MAHFLTGASKSEIKNVIVGGQVKIQNIGA